MHSVRSFPIILIPSHGDPLGCDGLSMVGIALTLLYNLCHGGGHSVPKKFIDFKVKSDSFLTQKFLHTLNNHIEVFLNARSKVALCELDEKGGEQTANNICISSSNF